MLYQRVINNESRFAKTAISVTIITNIHFHYTHAHAKLFALVLLQCFLFIHDTES